MKCEGQETAQRICVLSNGVQRGSTLRTVLDVRGESDATESHFRDEPVRLLYVSFPYRSTALGRLLVEMSRSDCMRQRRFGRRTCTAPVTSRMDSLTEGPSVILSNLC